MIQPDAPPSPVSTPSAPNGNSELSELKQSYASLASEAFTLRVCVLVLALLTLGFFVREFRYNGFLAERTRTQAAQVSKFEQSLEKQGTSIEKEIEKQGQAIQSLLTGLAEFSKVHPDFAPILAKYGVTVAPAPATPSPAPASPKK